MVSKGRLRVRNPLIREFMAEFLGTFIILLFGTGCVAQSVLSDSAKGDFFSINWGWSIGVMVGVLVAGGVSGAHLNPAVSLALACVGKFSPRKVALFWSAQYLGAFVGAAFTLAIYYDGLVALTEGNWAMTNGTGPGTAGIFATYPAEYLTTQGGLIDQVAGTMLLMLSVMAISDQKNMKVPAPLVPLYVGLTVLAIGICFGANCGYAINPARDLAPRLLTLIAGWGQETFSYRDYNWFWVPVIGAHVGAIVGAVVYAVFVEAHWPEEEPQGRPEYERVKSHDASDLEADASKYPILVGKAEP